MFVKKQTNKQTRSVVFLFLFCMCVGACTRQKKKKNERQKFRLKSLLNDIHPTAVEMVADFLIPFYCVLVWKKRKKKTENKGPKLLEILRHPRWASSFFFSLMFEGFWRREKLFLTSFMHYIIIYTNNCLLFGSTIFHQTPFRSIFRQTPLAEQALNCFARHTFTDGRTSPIKLYFRKTVQTRIYQSHFFFFLSVFLFVLTRKVFQIQT